MLVSDNICEEEDVTSNDNAVSLIKKPFLGDCFFEIQEVEELEVDQVIDPRLLQYANDENEFTDTVEDIPTEAKMPLPTVTDVQPTNLLPSDPSQSEFSTLTGVSSSTAFESVKPRPVQLTEVDNKYDYDEPLEFDMASDEEGYLSVDEVEEVSIVTACMKTHWAQMIKSRFFLFFIISVPTIVIPCTFLPFLLFEVDHIFIFIFTLLVPGMCIYLYYYENDGFFLNKLPDIFEEEESEEESEGFMHKILNSSEIQDYNPQQVYAF